MLQARGDQAHAAAGPHGEPEPAALAGLGALAGLRETVQGSASGGCHIARLRSRRHGLPRREAGYLAI